MGASRILFSLDKQKDSNPMKRVPAILLLLVATVSLALAQDPIIEYGDESELKGVTKVYIHTGMDLDLHRNISKDLKKKLPDLIICDKPEDAEVFLVFNSDSQTFLAGVSSTTNSQDTGYINGQSSTYGNSTTMNGTYSGQTTSTTTSNPYYQKSKQASAIFLSELARIVFA
jgi:hypothetical protein